MWKNLCLILCMHISVEGAELDVTPTSFLPGVTRSVQLVCRPSETTDIAQLLLLQILKVQASNREPLVTYVVGNPVKMEDVSVGLGITAKEVYQATDLKSSLLRVTISEPEDFAAGVYVCVVESIDSKGSLHRFMDSVELVSLDREGAVPIFYKTVLRELKSDLDILARDLTSVKDTHLEVDAQRDIAQTWLSSTDSSSKTMSDTSSAIDNIFQSARNRGEELGRELSRLRDITPETKVSFYAYQALTVNVASNANVVFNTLGQHTDNSYNITNGIFTAPVRGTYFLRTGVLVGTGVTCYVSIVAGDHVVASLYTYDDYNYKHSTASAVVSLEAGQQVRVVHKSSVTVALQGLSTTATLATHFMGALLW
ncbi:uncharacterized protein LOC112571074 isoform X2 [Pomacea canaliculata]|uniref:uncharacterized protein LOC112571074 isoform X2 n=1 Tax=Pomacea canaliculata TaxID=400727 RepID=UPI000D731AAC|nr:uncharacterized protein LOC112571074 isoform X2 [Pomacea canaliculata]